MAKESLQRKDLLKIFEGVRERFKDLSPDDLSLKIEYFFREYYKRRLYADEESLLRKYIKELRNLVAWQAK